MHDPYLWIKHIDEDFVAALGDVIRGIRKRRGETMVQFAKGLGTDQSMISRYESNKVVPSKSMALLIASVAEPSERAELLKLIGIREADLAGLGQRELSEIAGKLNDFFEDREELDIQPTQGLLDFTKLASQLVRENRDVDDSLVRILQKWIEWGDDRRARKLFKNLDVYLDIELKQLELKGKKTRRDGQ